MPSRVVSPVSVRLDLSGGDWILIKRQLNHGEQTEMFARLSMAGLDGALHANPLKVGIAQATAYLLDWNLLGLDEKPLLIRDQPLSVVESLLNSFAPQDVAEIVTAIQTHIAAVDEERAAAKNQKDGVIGSPAISPSPAISAGGSRTSVN